MNLYVRYCNAYNAIIAGHGVEPVASEESDESAAAAMLGASTARSDIKLNTTTLRPREEVLGGIKKLMD